MSASTKVIFELLGSPNDETFPGYKTFTNYNVSFPYWETGIGLEEKLKGFTGSIEMRILVDSSGSACCTNIYNNTSTIKSAELREMVNQMTHWKPALQNGYKVVCYTRLYINFSNSKLTVTDGPEIK